MSYFSYKCRNRLVVEFHYRFIPTLFKDVFFHSGRLYGTESDKDCEKIMLGERRKNWLYLVSFLVAIQHDGTFISSNRLH